MIPAGLMRAGLRDLARRPLQTGLLLLGMALGVAVVAAIDLASEAARRGFEHSARAVAGRATHVVRGGPGGLPEEVYRALRVEHGLRASTPVVEGVVIARELGREPLRVLGVDALTDAPFRAHLGGGAPADAAFAAFFTDPAAALVGADFAKRHRLAPGAPLRVQAGDRVETLRVLGIVTGGEPQARLALDGLLLMDVASAQRLLAMPGRLSGVQLILGSEADAAAVARLLPPSARLEAAAEEARALARLTAAFELNLRALSLLALVVGMFLVYNTALFGVLRRRAVFGTLRALGATPGQLFRLVLVETLAAAVLAALLGLGLGYLLGQSVVRLVTHTINDLYYVVAVTGAPLTLATALEAVGLGIGTALLAALAPAAEAARVEPVTAWRPTTLETRARRLVPGLALAGLGLLAAGAAVIVVARAVPATFAGLFVAVLGVALAAPAFTVALMAVVARPAFAGPIARLAAGTVTRSISRTGVAAAALMVAVAVTLGVTVMVGSFRSTVESWLSLSLLADVYVSAPSTGGTRSGAVLSEDVRARVAAVPGVAATETIRVVHVASPLGEVQLAATDSSRPRAAALLRSSEGGPAAAWERLQQGAVLVSEPFARRHAIPARGGSVELRTDQGLVRFDVAGVYYDYASEQGTVTMARAVYERHWADRATSSVAAYVEPGRDPEAVAEAVRRALAGRALRVAPNAALRREALRVFDRTFAVTEALRLLAVVVALAGVWSAIVALQVERTRELGTLVAVGMRPRQLVGLTLLEAGFVGLAAGLLALPTGLALALVLVEAINVRSFGWSMPLSVPPGAFGQALVLSVGGALVAALYPVWRLRRLGVAEALRQD